MSFDCYGGAFTDDELAAGVPSILCGNYNDDYDAKVNRKETESSIKEYVSHKLDNTEIDIMKIVSGLDKYLEIKNKVIKKILLNSLDEMIAKYTEKESLPLEFVKIAKQRNGLEVLIKYFLKNDGGYSLTKELVEEINIFLDSIFLNEELAIVYERVTKIQKFIHQKIDDKYGYGEHLNLDCEKMKNLLSASRLHLNMFDIKNYTMNTLMKLINTSKQKSFKAYMSSNDKTFSANKYYSPMWKARGMKPLIYFLESYTQNKIYDIYNLDTQKNIQLFKEVVIKIYLNKSKNKKRVYNQLSESEWILLNSELNQWQEQVVLTCSK